MSVTQLIKLPRHTTTAVGPNLGLRIRVSNFPDKTIDGLHPTLTFNGLILADLRPQNKTKLSWGRKIAWWVRVLPTKPDHLSSIIR